MKTRILLSIIIFFHLVVKAQTPAYQWIKQIGGPDLELVAPNGLAADANGNVFLTGQFDSPFLVLGSFTLTNTSSNEYPRGYMVKYDASGNVIWAKTVSDKGNALSSGLSLDAAGNILVCGSFGGPSVVFGTFTLTNTPANPNLYPDVFIVKYDPNGNVLWAKSAGGTKNDEATGIACDVAGNAFLTGNFLSPVLTMGTNTLINSGVTNSSDLFVAKYDPSGNLTWAKGQGGNGNDESLSVASDPAGNVVITGFFGKPSIVFGSTTLTATGSYNPNLFVVKYDGAGNVLWAKGGNGTSTDQGCSIATDGAGNILVTGYFFDPTITFATTTLTNNNGVNVFVVKYDSGGNVIWAKSDGAYVANTYGLAIASNAAGDVVVTGVFSGSVTSFGTTTLTNTNFGGDDMFIVRFDANGTAVWAESGGGTDDDAGNSVAIDANQNVLVGGAFQSTAMILGATTLTNKSTFNGFNHVDAFVMKLGGSTTSMGKNNVGNEFSVFPNPVHTHLTIQSGTSEAFKTELFDINGNLIHSTIATEAVIIRLQDFSAGVYILKITNDKGVITKKIVVTNN